MDDMSAFERQVGEEILRIVGPARPVDDLAAFELATDHQKGWGFTVFSALRFVAAAAIVASFGGFLLAGVLSTQPDGEAPPAAVAESPAPKATEELLSGMVTEEVEPGVFRVDHDGFRDLTSVDYSGVFAGQDGSIWLDHSDHLSRLGVAEADDWQLGEWRQLMDLEVAHDGTVWAVAFGDEAWSLRSFDGETWTTRREVSLSRGIPQVEITSDGVVWATFGDGSLEHLDADGLTWRIIETPWKDTTSAIREFGLTATESDVWAPFFGGVWHYADGDWERNIYGWRDARAMPDDVFWGLGPGPGGAGNDVILYRHDATGWQEWSLSEHDMLPGGWGAEPHAIAPDGSFWQGWGMSDGSCEGVSRFDGQTWVRYLPGMCVSWLGGMDIAPDGSVWVHAREREAGEDRFSGSGHLYVITPEASAARETETTEPSVDSAEDMVTEEVEPGVFRVIHDGVRDLASADNREVIAGYDDGIWLLREEGFLRLGDEGSHVWPNASGLEGRELSIGPDGTIWAIPRSPSGARSTDLLHSDDGEEWTEQPCHEASWPSEAQGCVGVTLARDGTVWASWRDEVNRWQVGHLGPTGWQALDEDRPSDGGPRRFDRLLTTDAGDLYGVVNSWVLGLFRYDDGAWRPINDSFYSAVDVGPDGTVWGTEGNRFEDVLARLEDGEWTRWSHEELPEMAWLRGGGQGFGIGFDEQIGHIADDEFRVAPDGSLWAHLWRSSDDATADDPSVVDWERRSGAVAAGAACDGLVRFDGETVDHFLTDQCVSFDIASDGSVWALVDGDDGGELHVITPEAVTANG